MTYIGKIIFFFLLYISFCNCRFSKNEDKIIGVYSSRNFQKTFDTIMLLDGNEYSRAIYSKSKEVIFKNTGNWYKQNDVIYFTDFLVNNNELSDEFKYDDRDLTNAYLGLRYGFNSIKICENYDMNYYWLRVSK